MASVLSRRQLPAFRTDAQERAFWKTHRPGDYVAAMAATQVQLGGRLGERVKERKKNLTLRMEPTLVHEIKAVAEDKGLPYQTLMRMWLLERLRQERAG